MTVLEVENATGNYDTNFVGKAKACVDGLKKGLDFVYVHMEAPDECGHHGDLKHKIWSIEQIDEKVVGPVMDALNDLGEPYAILVAPDHPTPISIKTHSKDAVPYILYRSDCQNGNGASSYDENNAKNTGAFEPVGYKLVCRFLGKQ